MDWHSTSVITSPTWSASRDRQLQTCERRYFYQYLAKGRVNSEDRLRHRVGLFKKLQTVAMWQGDCFHWATSQYLSELREGPRSSLDELIEKLQAKMNRDWQFSATRAYRKQPLQIGRVGAALLEHEYDEMPADVTIDALRLKTETMLRQFWGWAETNEDLPGKVRGADRVWIEPPAFGPEAPGFTRDDVQVITKVDFAWERVGSEFSIYDWKTGQAPRANSTFLTGDKLQIAVYQLWPHLGMDIPLGQVTSRLVYFGGTEPEQRTYTLEAENMSLILLAIQDSIRLTRRWEKYLREGQVSIADFGYAATTHACRSCAFKRLCRESLAQGALS